MGIQIGWAACAKCQGLFFGPFKGKCPADGGEHSQTHSFMYAVGFDVPAADRVQHGWASCPRCQGLHYAGFQFKGACPAGGMHQQAGSFAYALAYDAPPAPFVQSGWRACPKCQGLFYGPFKGRCPADGGEHSGQNSFNYSLQFLTRRINPTLRLIDRVTEVEAVGDGFTRDSEVIITYQYNVFPPAPSKEYFRHGSLTASADGDGNFHGMIIEVPTEARNISAGAKDVVTDGDNVESNLIRPK